jgi:hypothetical protein
VLRALGEVPEVEVGQLVSCLLLNRLELMLSSRKSWEAGGGQGGVLADCLAVRV